MEYKVDIGGRIYGMSELTSVTINRPLFESFSAGNACSAKIEVVFLPGEEPPRMATIIPSCREDESSEWVQLGIFYTDERTAKTGRKTIIGYDAMLKSEEQYQSEVSEGEWPRPMTDVVSEICTRMKVGLDPRTYINPAYKLVYPLKYTMRELLKHIAVANGGNWIITNAGLLYLVPLFPSGEVTNYDVGQKASSFETYTKLDPISGIDVKADDKYSYFSGNETGYVMKMSCPSITKEMVDDLYNAASGFVYQGFSATGIFIPPEAELGSTVTVDGFTGLLADYTLKFGSGHLSNVSAPGSKEVEHEYQYSSASERDYERYLAKTRAEITVKTNEIMLEVQDELTNMSSSIDLTLGSIKLEVVTDTEGNSILELTGDSITAESAKINLSGFVTFTGLADGTTTIDGGCIKTGTIDAELVNVLGALQTLQTKVNEDGTEETIATGYMGAATGLDAAGNTTYGVAISSVSTEGLADGGKYLIVTDGGVRMQAGLNSIVVTESTASLVYNDGEFMIRVGEGGCQYYKDGTWYDIGSGGTGGTAVWG